MNAKTQKILIYTGLTLVGGTITYFVGKKVLKKIKAKKQVTGFTKSTVTLPSGVQINPTEVARQLGLDLGFAYPSWDPRSWTENDDTALSLLKTIPKSLMPQVALQYFKIYNRNLQADCQKVLDGYSQIAPLFL